VVFEDTPAGIEAGQRAGMTVVGLTTTMARAKLPCAWHIDDFRALGVTVSGA
jgi:sugar-phosphatase